MQGQAHADRAQVLPADAGAHGLASPAVPHDRGAALVGDADRLLRAAVGEGGAGDLEHRRGHGGGVELHEAWRGCRGQHLSVVHVLDGGIRPHDRRPHPAGPDVDHQQAHEAGGRRARSAALRAARKPPSRPNDASMNVLKMRTATVGAPWPADTLMSVLMVPITT